MTREEASIFVEEMGRLKDEWEIEMALRMYREYSLQEALDERKREVKMQKEILEKALKMMEQHNLNIDVQIHYKLENKWHYINR